MGGDDKCRPNLLKMHETIHSLQRTIMSRPAYFADLRFAIAGHKRGCTAVVDRSFPFYALNYAHRGPVRWTTRAGQDTVLHGPVAWWMWPDHHYRYGRHQQTQWDHAYVTFTGPRVRRWISGGLFPERHPAEAIQPVLDPGLFAQRFEQVLTCLSAGQTHWPAGILGLETLFLQLAMERSALAGRHDPRQASMQQLAGRISQDPAAAWDFAAEAARLAISPVHFRRLFRLATGLPPVRYLLRARLGAAARLLRQSQRPVKEIAAHVRCPDIYYFTRLFTREYGLSPAVFRRLQRHWGDY
jgi:AraC-like DNA-binding protein